jgi:hypothetical protein
MSGTAKLPGSPISIVISGRFPSKLNLAGSSLMWEVLQSLPDYLCGTFQMTSSGTCQSKIVTFGRLSISGTLRYLLREQDVISEQGGGNSLK